MKLPFASGGGTVPSASSTASTKPAVCGSRVGGVGRGVGAGAAGCADAGGAAAGGACAAPADPPSPGAEKSKGAVHTTASRKRRVAIEGRRDSRMGHLPGKLDGGEHTATRASGGDQPPVYSTTNRPP